MKAKRELPVMRLQRLLVAIDFSESSLHALRRAVEMVAGSNASLLILHVVPANYGLLEIGREGLRDFDAAQQQQAAARLRVLVETTVPREIETDLEVRVGRPADEIVAAASEAKSDLIVLSTHGHTALDRLLLGSVADRVIRITTTPLLLIPPAAALTEQKRERSAVLRFKRTQKRALQPDGASPAAARGGTHARRRQGR
ncbi:MAG: universal stress protein [Chthoniobacterales bacterium]